MVHTTTQKWFIAFAAVIVLVIGVFIGSFLAVNTGGKDIDAIIISLSLTTIALLLIIASFILEIWGTLQLKKK